MDTPLPSKAPIDPPDQEPKRPPKLYDAFDDAGGTSPTVSSPAIRVTDTKD